MNKENNNITEKSDMDLSVKPKSLTPSVLGVPNSHGIKLSANMTSEDKKELMSKLEEWRKARRDKLAARILARQSQIEKTNATKPVLPLKSKTPAIQHDGASKFQNRQSVFERLYNNNNNSGKIKKPDVSSGSNRPTLIPKLNIRKSSATKSEKQSKPVQESHVGVDGTDSFRPNTDSSTSVGTTVGKESEVSSRDEPVTETSEEKRDTESRDAEAAAAADVSESTGLPETNYVQTEQPVVATSSKVINETETTETDSHKSVLENSAAKTAFQSVKIEKHKIPLRRSISMTFREKRRKEHTIRRSVSAKNLKELNLSQQKLHRGSVNAVQRPSSNAAGEGKIETAAKSVSFVTPKYNKSLGSNTLRNKLEDWLKKNGIPLESYRHLRCFGIANSERSLPSTTSLPLDRSFESSCYATAPNTPANDVDKENLPPVAAPQQVDMTVVENWLKELHRLTIELKYPPERCEEWLTAIRKKCGGCTQLPIYWECLAALHESKGDLKSAIEDYERVIIKGGEVDAVGESLAQLFEKMVIEQNQGSKPKLEKGLDPKNIFKSTIIKFALQQKAIKKLSSELDPGVRQQLYVATPVRRSSRIQTPYKASGEVASLQTLTPELRKNVIFKPNESLLRRD